MNEKLIAANLAAVEAHFHSEASNEIEKALELYTDDIVWESPARNLIFRGKEATGKNYRRMFSSFKVKDFHCLESHFGSSRQAALHLPRGGVERT